MLDNYRTNTSVFVGFYITFLQCSPSYACPTGGKPVREFLDGFWLGTARCLSGLYTLQMQFDLPHFKQKQTIIANHNHIKIIMSLFSDREIKEAKEQAINEELRKSGLGHLRPKIIKTGNKEEIVFDGATEDEELKAFKALGGTSEDEGGIKPIESFDNKIRTQPTISSAPKVETQPKSK